MKLDSRIAALILLVLTACVYVNTLGNEFTQDDYFYIVPNEQIRSTPWRLFAVHPSNGLYRPVTMLSFALNYAVGGLHPQGFHFLNVLLHGMVSVLLYALLSELLNRPRAAFAAALTFAVHPIHTEAVASAANRAELLAAGFLLLAWWMHLRGREAWAAAIFAVALLSKESAVAFLALAPVADYACRLLRPRTYAIYATVLGAFLVVRRIMAGGLTLSLIPFIDNPLAHQDAYWRVLNALQLGWKYVALQIYPVHLSADYSYNALPVSHSWLTLLPALLGWAAVLTLWVRSFERNAAVAVAGSIWFAGFALSSNVLFPIGTIFAERLAYLPSAAICLVAGLAWERLLDWRKEAAGAALAVVLALFSMRTVARNLDWRSNLTLYNAAATVVPESAKVRRNVGANYMTTDRAKARAEFDTAFGIYPDYPDLLAPMGLLYYQMGDKARAERYMEVAVGSSGPDNPLYDEMATNYAALLRETGREDRALQILDRLVLSGTRYARVYSNRAVIHFSRGNLAAARADAEAALKIDPENLQAKSLLAKGVK